MTRGWLIATMGAALLAWSVVASTLPSEQQPGPLEQFAAAVHSYVQLHRAIEHELPALRAGSHAHELAESSDAVAAALQTARANAREGDIFTAAVGALLRTQISEALDAHGFLPDKVVASSLEEADDNTPLPFVNGRFPWRRGAMMWPCVIDVLPELPHELQYRIVGRDLVLLDTHAELVVDILRDAVR
jgi:hypothetical protein